MTEWNSAERKAREDLAAAHQLIAREGMNEGTWTHLSLVHPERPDDIFVTPGDMHFSVIRASDMLVMNGTAEVIEGDGNPNVSAWVLHYPMHEARPDARCLIHAHGVYSTALFLKSDVVLNTRITQAASAFDGEIAYFDVYDGPLTGREEGERMAAALGDKWTLVLRNHGVMVAGRSVADAFIRFYGLERACRYQLLASHQEGQWSQIPDDVMVAIAADRDGNGDDSEASFAGWKMVLDRSGSAYMQ